MNENERILKILSGEEPIYQCNSCGEELFWEDMESDHVNMRMKCIYCGNGSGFTSLKTGNTSKNGVVTFMPSRNKKPLTNK